MRCLVSIFAVVLLYGDLVLGTMAPVVQCPKIKLKNGRARYRSRGRFVKFMCNTGYMLAGDKYTTCAQGRWDNSFPKCVRPTCQNVKPPINGLIYPSHGGAVLNFYCKANYQLKGALVVYCDGKQWDNYAPSCLATNSSQRLACDFESDDLCGWSHDLNHDFDWKRLNFQTPSGSIGTGPSYDHTKGKGKDGFYMYIESSQRNENDTARLISPVYDKTGNNTCFEFYYHMYGATTGDLRVYLKKTGVEWELNPTNALFAKNGNQGNHWYRELINLGTMSEDYQIIIEGVRGNGYVSDIAIDDVKIIENCVYEDEMPSTTESIGSTEPVYTVESCENRCGYNATLEDEQSVITCDCDEKCYDNNRCCPDYIDYCVLGTSVDDFDDDRTEAPGSSSAPDLTTADDAEPSSSPPTNDVRATIPKVALVTGAVRMGTLRPLQILTKPTTIKIYEKTIRTKPPKLRKATESSKIVYVKPDRVNDMSNDVVDVPPASQTDEPEEPPRKVDSPLRDVVKQKIIVENHEMPTAEVKAKSHSYPIVLTVGVVFGVVFGLSIMAVTINRYSPRCRHRLRRQSSSQSDVRFLTSDEHLDFSLSYDE